MVWILFVCRATIGPVLRHQWGRVFLRMYGDGNSFEGGSFQFVPISVVNFRIWVFRYVSGTSVTLKHKNCVVTVDKNWLTFDTKVGTLVLQRLGFFNDSILKCTTSFPAQNGECFENVRDKSHSLDDREHGCPILSQPEGTGCASQRRAIYRCDFPRIAAGKTIFLHLGPPQRSPHRR